MIRFEHTEYLWFLAGVVFLGVCIALTEWHRQRRMKRWADKPMLPRLVPDRRIWRPVTKALLLLLGISFLVVALANPLKGTKMEKGKRAGSDIAICLDVSNSMMADDLKPNRLARSKQAVTSLLNTMTGDRVSLVVFAGTSFIEMPLTNDYNAAKMFLDQIDCSMVSTQGTAIGEAIETAMATFGYGDEDREWKTDNSRAIIVISDGENHEDDAKSAAKKAAEQGVRVCTIGMGTTNPTPIPNQKNGSYMRDHSGSVVITRLNEQMLRDIAQAGKGIYVHGGNNMNEISDLLETLQKNDFDEAIFNSFESHYRWPLLAGLVCLLAEMIIFERRNKKWRMAFLLAFLFASNVQGQSVWQTHFNEGNRLFRQQQYQLAADRYSKVLNDTTLGDKYRSKALYNLGNSFLRLGQTKGDKHLLQTASKCYSEALKLNSDDFRIHYNLGNSLHRQGKYLEAAKHYQDALVCSVSDDKQRADIMYNIGNSLFRETLSSHDTLTLKTAISCYRNALRLDPANANYRYNQTLAYRLLKQLSKPNRKKQEQQKAKERQKEQQKQQQQKELQQKQQQEQQKLDKKQKEEQKKLQEKQQQEQKKLQDKQQQEQKQQQGKNEKEQKKLQDKQKQEQKQLQDKQRQEQQQQQEKQRQEQQQLQNKQKQEQKHLQDKQNQDKQQSDQQQPDKQNQDKQQSGKQQRVQKKQDDLSKLNDELNREMQRHQQSQEQQQQEPQQQQGQQQQESQQQQGQQQQRPQQQNEQQQSGQQNQRKEGNSQQNSNNKKLNDEIKKELERLKQMEEDRKDEQNGEKDKQQGEKRQNSTDVQPQEGQKTAESQQPFNTQQGTVISTGKLDPNKKNAETLLEAVKNNERRTIKTQTQKGTSAKGHYIEKNW